jgi:hypothetical protein
LNTLVIGGYAVGYYGHPRATKDIDIWIEASATNIERVIDALHRFGFDLPILAQWKKDPSKTLRMGYPPARVEVLTQISGVVFEHAWPNRMRAELDGIPVNFIGLHDLKQNKKAASRHQDLADLENLP